MRTATARAPRGLAGTGIALALALVITACGGAAERIGTGDQPDAGATEGGWELVSGVGPDGEVELVDDHPVTLEIEGERWGGTAACNSYDATVTLDGDRVETTGFAVTEMACVEDGVMESEAAYLAALRAVETWAVQDDRLVLEGPGTELVLEQRALEAAAAVAGTA